MRKRITLFVALIFTAGLVACGSGEDIVRINELPSNLIETEKNLPEDFYELADQGVLVKKVTNQEDFLEQWDYFSLKNAPTKVIDWDNQVAIFLGVFESGSCPYQFSFVEVSEDKSEMLLQLEIDPKLNACTDDATPRTFVFTVDKNEISEVETVGIHNYGGLKPRVMFYE